MPPGFDGAGRDVLVEADDRIQEDDLGLLGTVSLADMASGDFDEE